MFISVSASLTPSDAYKPILPLPVERRRGVKIRDRKMVLGAAKGYVLGGERADLGTKNKYLREFSSSLEPNDRQNARKIILSSYTTWQVHPYGSIFKNILKDKSI